MEFDHYYTQRDFISESPSQHVVSDPSTSGGAGKIRIPLFSALHKPVSLHHDIVGSDDWDESQDSHGHKEDDHAQQLLDSLDFNLHGPHNMTVPFPSPRKIAGTRRVISAHTAQTTREQAGRKAGGSLNPLCDISSLPAPEVFQSITATPNLQGGSFEELRAECYAQSYIATGAPPPPSIPISINALGEFQPARSIPPTFHPHLIASEPHAVPYPRDVEMSD
ncbi:hypothetical protein J3R30DRAFT_3473820 [Lentinula aciculospora]|uniref:Uncharacterized protein n=1 Tax=Lentinula aciculospora TaxID=153920 RepID=A0A9W9DNX8_9AGAR|nr:hypothetical protein J3R30DRAFT_3473820 [Lentinula aciculospora]